LTGVQNKKKLGGLIQFLSSKRPARILNKLNCC